jgi:chromosome segregation ATPase
MENAIASMPHNEVAADSRNIDVVTNEIKMICMQARSLALTYAIEVGRRLEEAKAMLPYGEWGTWLKEKTEFSQSTANNLMRLYAEYGNEQIGFFGAEMNSQTLGKLTYTKALKLLALPEEEREAFVNDNNVEDMSTRELDRLIKERDEALKKAEKTDELTDAVNKANQTISNLTTQSEEAKAMVDKLTKQLDKAKESEKKAKDRYEMLKKNPTLSPDDMARLKAEADANASEAFKKQLEESLAEVNGKLQKAQLDMQDAEYEKKKAQSQLEDLKKQVQMADPAVATFKAIFDQAQSCLFNLSKALDEVKDEQICEKLTSALNSLCKQYIKE